MTISLRKVMFLACLAFLPSDGDLKPQQKDTGFQYQPANNISIRSMGDILQDINQNDCFEYYQDDLCFNSPPVLGQAELEKLPSRLKRAGKWHSFANKPWVKTVFPNWSESLRHKVEQSIIYRPETVLPNSIPQWLEPYQISIKTPMGNILQAYYKPPKTNQDFVWKLTHGNAHGIPPMANVLEASGLKTSDTGFLIYALPGYHDSTGQLKEADMIDAFQGTTDYLVTQGVERDRQPVMGISLGGAITTLGVAQDPKGNEHPAVVIVQSFTRSSDAFDTFLKKTGMSVKEWSRRDQLEQSYRADLAIKQLQNPLVVFCIGDEDSLLPPSMMEAQMTRLESMNYPNQKILVFRSEADHNPQEMCSSYAGHVDEIEAIAKFLKAQPPATQLSAK